MNGSLRTVRRSALWRHGGELEYPRCVAEFDDYQAAQRAVNFLVGNGFPVRQVALVGRGLRSVERITGAASRQAATVGAVLGAWLGLFGAVSLTFPDGRHRLGFLLTDLLLGAVVGLLWAQIQHFVLGRDFASVTRVVADSYELQVEYRHAEEARALLAGVPEHPVEAARW